MYAIYAYIGVVSEVNVGKYAIHGVFGYSGKVQDRWESREGSFAPKHSASSSKWKWILYSPPRSKLNPCPTESGFIKMGLGAR